MHRLFWLPHLHSFTRVSLARLFERAGYDVFEEEKSYPKQLTLIARRRGVDGYNTSSHDTLDDECSGTRGFLSGQTRSFEAGQQALQFGQEMRIGRMREGARYLLSWRTKSWRPELVPAFSSPLADHVLQYGEKMYDFAASRFLGIFANRRSCVVSGLRERFCAPHESPIEIQYAGDIELLVK